MLTGKPPFYSKNKHEILKNITNNIDDTSSLLNFRNVRRIKVHINICFFARESFRHTCIFNYENQMNFVFPLSKCL